MPDGRCASSSVIIQPQHAFFVLVSMGIIRMRPQTAYQQHQVTDALSGPPQTPKMESFSTIVNGF